MIKYEDQKFLKIIQDYPLEVKNLLNKILQKGFSLVLVGGAVRDFLLHNKLTTDLDFEIRKKNVSSKWEDELVSLFDDLSQVYPVEKLSFSVFRITLEGFDLEFASPRIEIYPKQNEGYGHSDFSVELYNDLSFEDAFARRDLTVNAIAVEVLESIDNPVLKLRDPFSGIKDLEKRLLKPCGQNFSRDPVRLLRSIRFSQSLEFEYSVELKNEFKKFDLTKLTSFYLLKEGEQEDLQSFLKKLKQITKEYKLSCFSELKLLLSAVDSFEKSSQTKQELLWDIVINSDLDSEEIYKVSEVFKIKRKVTKEFFHLKDFLQFMEQLDLSKLENIPDDINLISSELHEIFDWLNQGRKFFCNKGEWNRQLSILSDGKLDFLNTIFDDLNQLEKEKKFIEKRKNIDNNLRSIFSLFTYFTKE